MKRGLAGLLAGLLILLSIGCAQQQQQQEMEYIGSEQAKVLALQDAGLSAGDAAFTDIVLDQRNGLDYYRVKFTAQGQAYEYDIDALTGVVIESAAPTAVPAVTASSDPAAISSATPSETSGAGGAGEAAISAEDAKGIALAHAGLAADQVRFVKTELDWDDGRQYYDVEFYAPDAKEYDYKIDPQSGEIISYDFDADSYAPAASGSSITADRAKEIALEQVPGATTAELREFETDYDDGRLVYEGKILYDGREYEFEIDGYSGAIRSWESDLIGH